MAWLHTLGACAAAAALGTLPACGLDSRAPGAEPGRPAALAAAALTGPRWLLQHGTQALPTSGLVQADGRPLQPQALRGGWTVVSVGFTTCSQTCPATLALLSAWAQQGGANGDPAPRMLFSSIDPLNDSPQRLRSFMAAFDSRITATTGQPAAAQAWATALGAGVAPGDGGIDHSTSLFVIGPDAHLAGVLLRPGSVAGLAADLRALQAARQAASQTAGS